MSFREPAVLIGLALLPLAAAAYAVMQRRRRADAARFGNPALLPGLATARPGWRRHLPPLLLLLALGALVVAIARPQRSVAAPQRQATVMMVTDVSGSMRATDVEPDRLSAAVEAGHALADKLPDKLRLGLVSFSDYAEQTVPPTTEREPVEDALDRLVGRRRHRDGRRAAPRHRVRAHAGPERGRQRLAPPARGHRAALRRQEHLGQRAARSTSPARRRR